MLRMTLLCVGTPRSTWIQEGLAQYAERLRYDIELDIVSLPASKEKEPTRQREDESSRILDAVSKRDGEIWLLDEKGKAVSSVDFSNTLQTFQDSGTSILFVLGGAFGVTDVVRHKAKILLKLSDMTLTHELCQLVFLEQLYRAIQIQKGTGYHH